MQATSTYAQRTCRFCGANSPVVLRRPSYGVRQCPDCRVMWCDPLRFDDAFRPDDEKAYLEAEADVHRANLGRLAFTQRFAPPSTHPRLVEVGCMHGDFVLEARSAGYDAIGYDLSSTAVELANTRRPGLARLTTLDESQPDASLDVVAAFNVIEHMERPEAFLDRVDRVLRPGGVLVLETPAQESLYHHVLFARGRLLADRPRLEVGVHPGTHIFKFGRRAWRRILRRWQFDVLGMRPVSTPLRELLAKNPNAPLAFRAGIVGVGLTARVLGLDNRIQVAARRRART